MVAGNLRMREVQVDLRSAPDDEGAVRQNHPTTFDDQFEPAGRSGWLRAVPHGGVSLVPMDHWS